MCRFTLGSIFLLSVISSKGQETKLSGWHLKDTSEGYLGISLHKAYELLQGKKSESIIVAVIDSGIDTTHEDLKPVLWINRKEIPGNGVDDDNNGYIDDIHGWNFTSGDSSDESNNDLVKNISPHGTKVSGVIAAVRNNDMGINGIADNVRVMMVRAVLNNKSSDRSIAYAIRYAVDNGARIINISLADTSSLQKDSVDKAVQYAVSNNVLIVHSAGNEETNVDKFQQFPSPFYSDSSRAKSWIEVGASAYGMNGSPKASFSNYGRQTLDVFAPGVYIYTTAPGSKYVFSEGTSMAAPVVSGIAALIWSYYPKLTAVQIKKIIEQSAIRLALKMKLDKFCRTGGVANAFEAIRLASVF